MHTNNTLFKKPKINKIKSTDINRSFGYNVRRTHGSNEIVNIMYSTEVNIANENNFAFDRN